jgi:hypothetical protein
MIRKVAPNLIRGSRQTLTVYQVIDQWDPHPDRPNKCEEWRQDNHAIKIKLSR